MSDFFFSRLRLAKKALILVKQQMCKSYVYNWGVESSLHIKLVDAGLRTYI
jgi:hypothetical protein